MSTSPPAAAPDVETAAKQIARGQQTTWAGTFDHPTHGELTFTAPLPKAHQLLEHRVEMDNRLHRLDGEPSASTVILVAALAGMTVLAHDQPSRGIIMTLPAISESRTEDPDRGSIKVDRVYYDADDEPDIGFLADVWLAYSAWRTQLLEEGLDAVKGS